MVSKGYFCFKCLQRFGCEVVENKRGLANDIVGGTGTFGLLKQRVLKHPLPAIRSLRIFKRTCALKNDILLLLQDCKFLNPDQEEAVKQTFKIIDKDGDGIITADELFDVMKQIDPNITKDEVKEITLAVDVNGDEVLTMDEFLNARINRKVVRRRRNVQGSCSSVWIWTVVERSV